MDHIAIDLGGKESQICVRSCEGRIVLEERRETWRLGAFLGRRERSRVILETCAEAFAIADRALEQGHEVRVVPSTLVRGLGVGARGIKTDVRDARALSEASCRMDLPSVHVPSKESRRRKSLCGMREALVGARTQLINTVRGWLRTQGRRVRSGGAETFPERVRKQQEQEHALGLPRYVERQLETLDVLTRQIREADAELAEEASKDATCRRLMTVPGVGPVTALRYVAALDDRSRFKTAHQVESYTGLVPGEASSSENRRRTSLTKAGAPALRWALVQAAWSMRRCRPNDPAVRWCLDVERRRGKRIAVAALARKIVGILFAIWRDGTTYDPQRGAKAQNEPMPSETGR